MKTDEIVKLTRNNIAEFLAENAGPVEPHDGPQRRREPRWPFPGAVEVYPCSANGSVQWLGTLRNVSASGLGMSCERYLKPETLVDISFHMPDASFYGKAVVRYCQQVRNEFMCGVEFLFDE